MSEIAAFSPRLLISGQPNELRVSEHGNYKEREEK